MNASDVPPAPVAGILDSRTGFAVTFRARSVGAIFSQLHAADPPISFPPEFHGYSRIKAAEQKEPRTETRARARTHSG
jgi:hypothetical protein